MPRLVNRNENWYAARLVLVDYDLLKSFAVVGRSASFAAAARARSVSQPAISAQMKTLEGQLGLSLFDRSGRRATLTSVGETLLEAVLAAYDRIDQTIDKLVAEQSEVRGVVQIGGAGPFARLWLQRGVRQLAESYPDLEIRVRYCDGAEVEDEVRERRLDFGISTGAAAPADLRSAHITDEETLAVASSSYFATRYPPTSAADFRALDWIATEQQERLIRPWWKHVFGAKGLPPARFAYEVSDLNQVLEMVKSGLGVSVLPRYLAQASLDCGQLTMLEAKEGRSPSVKTRPVFLVWRNDTDESARFCAAREALLEASFDAQARSTQPKPPRTAFSDALPATRSRLPSRD